MRRLALGVALAWLVAGVAVPRLPAAPEPGAGATHRPRPVLASVVPIAVGPALIRAGSAPSPEQDAQTPAVARALPLPPPPAAAAPVAPRTLSARRLPESPHPQRGPPPPA